MTRLWTTGHAIEVERNPRASTVRAFTWRGRMHTVQKVRQRWQVDTDWWSEEGRVHRDYWRVTTTDGLCCDLYLDLLDEQWYIARCYD